MYEKVNPYHPDKVADRIAGAIVDLAYKKSENPKIAVEVLIGHGHCSIVIETSEEITYDDCQSICMRIGGIQSVTTNIVKQDENLSRNQQGAFRCGDNGIFRGSPVTSEQKRLKELSVLLADKYKSDGKYLITGDVLIICQSNAANTDIEKVCDRLYPSETNQHMINPLGYWTGGTDVDTGCTNRKLGSDMGDGVTGGGLHGKDLSKADVTCNIICHELAQKCNKVISAACAIGDETVKFTTDSGEVVLDLAYSKCVDWARDYIKNYHNGSFEKFAEYGLI